MELVQSFDRQSIVGCHVHRILKRPSWQLSSLLFNVTFFIPLIYEQQFIVPTTQTGYVICVVSISLSNNLVFVEPPTYSKRLVEKTILYKNYYDD